MITKDFEGYSIEILLKIEDVFVTLNPTSKGTPTIS
jgi:hypothetical protein